jgi:hypothetical protein
VFFTTSWGCFQPQFDQVIEDLRAHATLLDKIVSATATSESRAMREDLTKWRRENLATAAKHEQERAVAQYMAIVSCLKIDDSDQGSLSEAIMAEPQKYPETCNWIFKVDKIQPWIRCSQESPFLVLHGKLGAGKSVLAAQIVEWLRAQGRSLVVSHICSYARTSSTDYDQVLRSILLQLLQPDAYLTAHAYEELILKKKKITVQSLERLVLDTVGAISNNPAETKYVHVVFDGLDECAEEKRTMILNLLERMISTTYTSTSAVCKVLVTSYITRSVAKKLKQKPTVSLSVEKVALEKAIALYASQRLGKLRSRWQQMGIRDVDLEDLATAIAQKADG